MSGYRPAWTKLGACEEISELFKGCTVLQRYAHQAGDYVVKRDCFRSAVSSFHSKEDLGWGGIVLDGEIERPLVSNADLLGDVVAPRGKGNTLVHAWCPHSICAQIVTKLSSGEGENR